jgi:lipopolysaccharide export LptBFGC system permease protein LptF
MRTKIAIGSATLYLVILTILGQLGTSPNLCAFMYLFSPFIIIMMVYLVLTEKGFRYPELAEDEE